MYGDAFALKIPKLMENTINGPHIPFIFLSKTRVAFSYSSTLHLHGATWWNSGVLLYHYCCMLCQAPSHHDRTSWRFFSTSWRTACCHGMTPISYCHICSNNFPDNLSNSLLIYLEPAKTQANVFFVSIEVFHSLLCMQHGLWIQGLELWGFSL